MNEIIQHNENGLCISATEIGKIQKQPIYEIDKKEFLIEFSKLISEPNKINNMKAKTSTYIE